MVLPFDVSMAAEDGEFRTVVAWLRSASHDINERDEYGNTLLEQACRGGHYVLVTLLLKLGADTDAVEDEDADPIIHELASAGTTVDLKVAAILLDEGSARVDVRNGRGITALMQAAYDGNCRMLRLLLSRGADLDACDRSGDAVFHSEIGRKKEAINRGVRPSRQTRWKRPWSRAQACSLPS